MTGMQTLLVQAIAIVGRASNYNNTNAIPLLSHANQLMKSSTGKEYFFLLVLYCNINCVLFLLAVRLNAVPNVTINITRETRADLSCEMFDYIPPDEHLQWTTNGAVLENSEKYTITYQDGNQATAQIGGNTRLPSRISTLTIHTPTINDSGEYVCAVMGTSQFVTVNLMVENTRTTSVQTIPTTSSKC